MVVFFGVLLHILVCSVLSISPHVEPCGLVSFSTVPNRLCSFVTLYIIILLIIDLQTVMFRSEY